jgi:hypothetical protein
MCICKMPLHSHLINSFHIAHIHKRLIHVQNQIKYAAYTISWSTVLSPLFHKKLCTEFLIQFFKNNNTNAANVI